MIPIQVIWFIPLIIAQILSYFFPMKGGDDEVERTWYQRPGEDIYVPPGYVFGIVWPILYLLIGFVLANTKDGSARKSLIVNLVLNYLWIVSFNYFRNIRLSLIIMILLVLTLYYYFNEDWGQYSYLLIPYFIWLLYATYLNWQIYLANQ